MDVIISEAQERGPSRLDPELPGQNYFNRVNAIPLLSGAEATELISRWQRFRDERAREQVILAHLRIPPSVARKAAQGRMPSPLMSAIALGEGWSGHRELVEDLTAEGNLALCESVESFDPTKNFVFATYASRSIWNAVRRRLRSFASVVDRPWGKPTPVDIYINPMLPDLQEPDDYCGARAIAITPSDDDLRNEGDLLPGKYQRLRPEPPPDYSALLDRYACQLPRQLALVINLRRGGLSLSEVAEELGISTPTAWRLEQSAHERMRMQWNSTQSSFRATRAAV